MRKLLLLVMISSTFFSCSSSSNETQTIGSPYELIVVLPNELKKSPLEDTLKNIFKQPVQGITRSEPIFDMYSVIPKSLTTTNLGKHRNLLFVRVDPKYGVNEFYADTNANAKGQLSIYFQGPNADSLAGYIYKNRQYVTGILDIYERDRFISRVNKYNEQGLENVIKNKFDFTMKVPRGYRIKNDEDNLLWLSFETKLGSLNILIYAFDKKNDLEQDWLVVQRDLAVKNIPGPSENSYVATDKRFLNNTTMTVINEHQWYKTAGFWMVEKDFMGGPYINYVTDYKDKYIAIDFFVQDPDVNQPHRNYVRQFEALPYTIKFNK